MRIDEFVSARPAGFTRRRWTILIAGLTCIASAAAVSREETAQHKLRMNQAQELKYEVIEALQAEDLGQVASTTERMHPLLESEIAYWHGSGLVDIHELSMENLALARQVTLAARSADADSTIAAWEKLEHSCSDCHDQHPEHRIVYTSK
jgi:hypothetical protein